jgi:hypothetical protein
MKMAETSSSGPKRTRASGDLFEMVLAIFGPNSIWLIFFGPFEYSAQNANIQKTTTKIIEFYSIGRNSFGRILLAKNLNWPTPRLVE